MSAGEKRVVLVKPGDVLVISGAQLPEYRAAEAVGEFFRNSGIQVAIFGSDIEIGSGCLREVEAERDSARDTAEQLLNELREVREERDTMASLLHVRRDDDGNLLAVAVPDHSQQVDGRVAVMLEASREKLDRIRGALGVPKEASLPEAARTYRELAQSQAVELDKLRAEGSGMKDFLARMDRYVRLLPLGLPAADAWELSGARGDQ